MGKYKSFDIFLIIITLIYPSQFDPSEYMFLRSNEQKCVSSIRNSGNLFNKILNLMIILIQLLLRLLKADITQITLVLNLTVLPP